MTGTYQQALEDVAHALFVFAQDKGRAARAVLDAEDYSQVDAAKAIGEQGAAVDAHSLVSKMLGDHRKQVGK